MTDLVHTTYYHVRSAELHPSRTIGLPYLVQMFQEASMENILNLKASFWDESLTGATWILLRKEITIHRYPDHNEKVKVITYPSGFDKIFAYRDYRMYDQEDNLIASASSTWTYMNMKTRKMEAIPENLKYLDASDVMDVMPRPNNKIKLPKQWDNTQTFEIGRYHLDWNNHVNNIYYIVFILESLENEMYLNQPQKISIHFRGECFLQEKIHVSTSFENNRSSHQITKEDGSIAVIAQMDW